MSGVESGERWWKNGGKARKKWRVAEIAASPPQPASASERAWVFPPNKCDAWIHEKRKENRVEGKQ